MVSFIFHQREPLVSFLVFVKILDLLQEPRKTVTNLIDAGQTESMGGRQTKTESSLDGQQTKRIRARADLAAQGQPGQLARFAVKTGDNRQLTVIDRLAVRQADSNTGIIDQSNRLANALIQRKADYMKQYFRRGYLSLIV